MLQCISIFYFAATKEFCTLASSSLAVMAPFDPTLISLAVLSVCKIMKSYKKEKANGGLIMIQNNTSTLPNNYVGNTIHGVMCGVVGNAVTELVKQVPTFKNPLRRVFAF
ncbi:hypothetical protein [Pectobacterium polaris]|uniref:hypothetical protein n=1 Tax=Pectobacterium polaris TaxID=2042057 RepID=UPI001CF1658C|nr:hypothetical protein [Pectobacterium polaris]MCA6954649.1 hypothetical protein [Pectobacterium polaris]